MLPYLLAALSEVTYTNARGETFSGRILTDAMAVVYADRQDQAAARELSRLADVRVAWGGREAVEAIINLPRRYGTEDIVFGPKLSFAIVGRRASGRPGLGPPNGRSHRRRRLRLRPAGLQLAAYGLRRARRSDRAGRVRPLAGRGDGSRVAGVRRWKRSIRPRP